ncbi:unnamed protein product [Gemmata massiliana]|uniref:Uncharacterized protein n=1 Tax=Gemmata massiliana TaxID=1210884 RepID=A0A6P2DH78_9BACT|nr:unnamed protein product [Gemmata massiliana]
MRSTEWKTEKWSDSTTDLFLFPALNSALRVFTQAVPSSARMVAALFASATESKVA